MGITILLAWVIFVAGSSVVIGIGAVALALALGKHMASQDRMAADRIRILADFLKTRQ